MAGQFRSSVWDPVLIVSQIITMQSLYYLSLGLWIFAMDFIGDTYRSLDQIFSYQALQLKDFHGRLIIGSYAINALMGASSLWYIVKRTKQCLDYTVTVHLLHLLVCWGYNGAFPYTLSWWLINLICIILMTVFGEFLCMRTELKAIPLLGPKVDL